MFYFSTLNFLYFYILLYRTILYTKHPLSSGILLGSHKRLPQLGLLTTYLPSQNEGTGRVMGYSLEYPIECNSTPVVNSIGEGLENINGGEKGNGIKLSSPIMRTPSQRLGVDFPLCLL